MKNYLTTFLLSLTFFLFASIIGCSKKSEAKTKPLIQQKQKTLNIYSKYDVCDCNKEALEIIDITSEIRNTFDSIDELKNQVQVKNEIKRLAKNYVLLLETCFNNHNSKMFAPSDCNNLELLNNKKLKLIDLGIQLEQGEKIRL
tara:strand:- start:248 stop:679 length:432 start_codon:yes stop_codon:yes gene_type:complete